MPAIGIDLGTTNSCMAIVEGGTPEVIANAEGERTTPSIAAFSRDGERLVGSIAERQMATNPGRTISSVKRKMGTSWRIGIDGKEFGAPAISAMILRKLREDAERYLGSPVTDAVITVPAYFNDMQRNATKDAGTIAGLNVLRIINEPTAAALAYGLDHGDQQMVMVYDFGGGTFDVSVIEIGDNVIEVLSTAGNNKLGGDDFDAAVGAWLIGEFKRKTGVDLSDDMVAMRRVIEAAEQAKRELSVMESTTVNLPFISQGQSGPLNLEETITRAKFDELTKALVDATTEAVQQALNDAGIAASELGEVILVGGTTRIPAVQEHVKRLTGKTPASYINPDECVAQGAAIQAATLESAMTGNTAIIPRGGELLLLDVVPMSFSIETVGGVATRVIERNTTLPVHYEQIFTTAAPFQTKVEINVMQGERAMAADNKTIGKFQLKGIKRAPAGVPQINVSFDIDANGVLNVTAKDMGTGNEQSITITDNERMTDAEIAEAIRDAEQYAEEDAARREGFKLRDEALNIANEAQEKLKEASKDLDKEAKRKVKGAISNVQRNIPKRPEKMTDSDSEKLRSAISELKDAMSEL